MRCSRHCSPGCSRAIIPNAARTLGLARQRFLCPAPSATGSSNYSRDGAGRGSSGGSSSRRRHAVRLRSLADNASASTRSSVIASRVGDLAWASCVSSKPTVATAVADAAGAILAAQQQHQRGDGGGFEPELAVVFASCNYGPQLEGVVGAIRAAVPSVRYIYGCSAFGVLGSSAGGPLEVEGEPGLALSLAALPGCQLSVMHTLRSGIPTEDAGPEAWSDLVGMTPVQQLQHSRPPSPAGSADGDDEGKPAATAAAAAASSSSSSSSSNGDEGAAGSSDAAAADQVPADSGDQQRQQQQQPGEAVNFLLLCDPRFQQSKQLLAGLDFAFPVSNKVGGVLSQGQANKRRLMFAWSADGAVQPGTAAWRRKQARRRRQQQQAALAASRGASSSSTSTGSVPVVQPAEQQPQQLSVQEQATDATQQQQQQQLPGSKAPKKGLFGSLFDALLSGLSDEEQQQQPPAAGQQGNGRAASSAAAGGTQSAGVAAGGLTPAAEAAAAAEVGSDDDDDDDGSDSSGVFMYGAAVLAIKGPVALETITCQGYRTIGDKVWTVGETSRDGDLIATLIDPDATTAGDGPDGGGGGSAGSGGDVSVEASLAEEEGGGEVVPLVALFELLLQAGYDPEDASPGWIEALSEKLAVAVAPDSFTPDAALQPDDFTVAAIAEIWQSSGCIRIAGQARPGYRLKLVVRDNDGVRQDLSAKLLGLKRAELAGMLAGVRRPPPLAALLFSDIKRGSSAYEAPSYESSVVASFLPVPLAGMFGSAQISTANGKAGLYEQTSAIAVLRPLLQQQQQPQPPQQQQAQQQQEV